MSNESRINRLERYSLEHPCEVLVIRARIETDVDEIVIFKGFSSSLMRPTAFDLDVSVLPEQAEIITIDRMKGPLNPSQPEAIETDIPWSDFAQRLG